jgi:hypothetical protein
VGLGAARHSRGSLADETGLSPSILLRIAIVAKRRRGEDALAVWDGAWAVRQRRAIARDEIELLPKYVSRGQGQIETTVRY